jgi:hypothetical protein
MERAYRNIPVTATIGVWPQSPDRSTEGPNREQPVLSLPTKAGGSESVWTKPAVAVSVSLEAEQHLSLVVLIHPHIPLCHVCSRPVGDVMSICGRLQEVTSVWATIMCTQFMVTHIRAQIQTRKCHTQTMTRSARSAACRAPVATMTGVSQNKTTEYTTCLGHFLSLLRQVHEYPTAKPSAEELRPVPPCRYY